MALAKIKYRKVVDGDGVLRLEIIGWDGILSQDDLPIKYLRGYPCFYECRKYDSPFLVLRTERGEDSIFVGFKYTPEEFEKLVQIFKKAGERLAEINRELEKLRTRWCGEGEIII